MTFLNVHHQWRAKRYINFFFCVCGWCDFSNG